MSPPTRRRMCLQAKLGLVADASLLILASVLTVKTFDPADGLTASDFYGPALIVLALLLGTASYFVDRRYP